MSKWEENWQVQSESDPSKYYTVSRATDGGFGCSCPAWAFRRLNCKHIRAIAASLIGNDTERETYARLMFIAKINGITLSCDNCAHMYDYYNSCNSKNLKELLFAKGNKKTFYILGRCCVNYEKKGEE